VTALLTAERRGDLAQGADERRDARAQLDHDEAAVVRHRRRTSSTTPSLDDVHDRVGDRPRRLRDLDVEVLDVRPWFTTCRWARCVLNTSELGRVTVSHGVRTSETARSIASDLQVVM
jgi:hypothetical protein